MTMQSPRLPSPQCPHCKMSTPKRNSLTKHFSFSESLFSTIFTRLKCVGPMHTPKPRGGVRVLLWVSICPLTLAPELLETGLCFPCYSEKSFKSCKSFKSDDTCPCPLSFQTHLLWAPEFSNGSLGT